MSGAGGHPARGPGADGDGARRPRRWWAGAVGTALLVLVAPVGLARLLGLDTTTPGAQLVGFVPLVVPVLALALGLLLLARRRVTAVVTLVALATHVGWSAPPVPAAPGHEAAAPAGDAPGAVVTVLSVNARFGNASPAEVVEAVRAHEVDVLLVQELTPGLDADLGEAGLAELLPHAVTTPGAGPDGTGTFSRWPQERLAAPPTTFATVRSRVEVPGAPLTVTNVHTWPPLPGTVDRWRADHVLLREVAAGTDAPHVLAGDLNAGVHHSVFRELLATGLRDAPRSQGAWWAPTWPGDRPWPPLLALDHVLVAGVDVREVRRLDVGGTDHLAVLAELAPA